MARTQVRTKNIEDGGVMRDDLNTSQSGQAVTRKIIQGTGIVISSTGVDAGTGDVTIQIADSISVADTLTIRKLHTHYTLALNGEGNALADLAAAPYLEYGDMLRWQSPITAEYHNGTSFVTYSSPPNWKKLTDGKGDTAISIDYTHRKLRLTYDVGSDYHMSSHLIIKRNLSYPIFAGSDVKVTYEESQDNATWTTRIVERTMPFADSLVLATDDGNPLYFRYCRVTIEWVGSSGNVLNLANLQLRNYRPGDQGGTGLHKLLPIDWDEDRAVTMSGDVTIGGAMKAFGGYKSSSDNPGISTVIANMVDKGGDQWNITVENGLIVDVSPS